MWSGNGHSILALCWWDRKYAPRGYGSINFHQLPKTISLSCSLFHDPLLIRNVPLTSMRYPAPQMEFRLIVSIIELTLTPEKILMVVGGFRIGGGGHLLALSYPVLKSLLSRIEDIDKLIVLYRHTLLSEFRHYLNLDKTASCQLPADFQFDTLCEVVLPIRQQVRSASARRFPIQPQIIT